MCGPKQIDPDSRTTVINPSLVVEVLSDSTENYDRGERAEHYRQITSLRVCVFVSQRKRHIEVWRRGADGGWSCAEYGPGGTVELDALGVSFAVDEVYRGVVLTA